MVRTNQRIPAEWASALLWAALAFGGSACVAKPAFHCQSDESCVSADGSRGTCQASGECSFRSAPDDAGGAGGASGASAPTAGSASSAGGTSGQGGLGGSTGGVDAGGEVDEAGAAGAAGATAASCTDEAAGNCYSCSPKTSAQ
ncbi:MAG TPA: hypothetical protein VF294_10590, partial [Polyangiaceae bacterium]